MRDTVSGARGGRRSPTLAENISVGSLHALSVVHIILWYVSRSPPIIACFEFGACYRGSLRRVSRQLPIVKGREKACMEPPLAESQQSKGNTGASGTEQRPK